MTVNQVWMRVPGYPYNECLYDRSKGVKVRSVRRPRPKIGGRKVRGFMGGNVLSTANGRYRLKGLNGEGASFMPDDIWDAVFKGGELVALRRQG